jgi:hypothetical protein
MNFLKKLLNKNTEIVKLRAVAEEAKQLVKKFDNPAPDLVMRRHWLQLLQVRLKELDEGNKDS